MPQGDPNKSISVTDKEGKYLTFAMADEDFGIGILKVKEIIGMMMFPTDIICVWIFFRPFEAIFDWHICCRITGQIQQQNQLLRRKEDGNEKEHIKLSEYCFMYRLG
jgi:hypothetical protein